MRKWRLPALLGAILLVMLAGAGYLGYRRATGTAGIPTVKVKANPFCLTIKADGILKASKATPVSVPISPHTRRTLAWIAEDGTPVKTKEVVARFDPSDFEQKLLDSKADRETARAKIEKAESDMKLSNLELGLNADISKKELDQAESYQATDDKIFSKFDIANSRIDTKLAGSRLEHAEALKKTKNRVSKTDIDLLKIEEHKANIEIKEAREALESVVVKAPHNGVLVLKRDWRGNQLRAGATVFPGQKLAEIPDTSTMQAKVFVLEADAGDLEKGQSAVITLDADPDKAYKATVSRVDTLAQPRYPGVPVQYFGVTLSLDSSFPEKMKPGQRLHAVITMADMKNALVIPRQAVFIKRGKTIVYRKKLLGGFTPLPVELGPGVLGRVVIKKGIETGNVIALLDPTESPIKKKKKADKDFTPVVKGTE